jgi:integrase
MDFKKQLERYLLYLDKEMPNQKYGRKHVILDKHNANLIREFASNYRALPSEPGEHKTLVLCHRLSSTSRMLDSKHLDELIEDDLKKLNVVMRERKLKSAYEFRKTLKRFLKLKDKKKYFEIIDSEYLKSANGKNNGEKPVDPNEFWDAEHVDAYIRASRNYSPRQLAWASIWLTSGCRPHEILNLRKIDLEVKNSQLVIRIRDGKTGSRIIVLDPQETIQAMEYLNPYLDTLEDNQKLFSISWRQQDYIHKRMCKKINLPEHKSRHLYIARKMCLTKFYNTYGLAKAAQMAGHTPGAKAMRHYIALKETELLGEELHSITKKICPNQNCHAENDASETQCVRCKSPLDRQAFATILNQNLEEKISSQLELIKKDLTIKMLTINQQPIAQMISPSK